MENHARFDICQNSANLIGLGDIASVVGHVFAAIEVGVTAEHRDRTTPGEFQQMLNNVTAHKATSSDDENRTQRLR